ncbi:ABC transporter permease [Parabacteroides goldsteinii]|nr:ABC transporter permease [Parabacteroides goldsteinii]
MIAQFVISICFIFCAVILMKQIHHLNQADFGFERTNRACINTYPSIDGLREEMAKVPFITEIFPDSISAIFPRYARSYSTIDRWDGRQDSTASVSLEMFDCNQAYFKFYEFQLLEGEIPADGNSDHILINQAGIKELNMDHPIGKTIGGDNPWIISGVIKDFYIAPPTVPCKPGFMVFKKKAEFNDSSILFKYQEGTWTNCKQRLDALVRKLNPDVRSCRINNMEEEYGKFLKSENALLMMLDFVTLVCVLISLFGVFSLVTLDCEKRRKEIAIRKVNGAVTPHIMQSFLLKYMLLLLVASAIAFPTGYLIMKPWVESYVLQTRIDFWIYPVIWLVLAALITLCTGWRIWRAANQNPAEVIKSE